MPFDAAAVRSAYKRMALKVTRSFIHQSNMGWYMVEVTERMFFEPPRSYQKGLHWEYVAIRRHVMRGNVGIKIHRESLEARKNFLD